MKERFFDTVILLMFVVAVSGVKTESLNSNEPQGGTWMLEEASFLSNSTTSRFVDRNTVQAVTRLNEGAVCINKCGVYPE